MTNTIIAPSAVFMRRIESITGLENGSKKVTVTFEDGASINQYHKQECCEGVYVEQVDADPDKFIGAVLHSLEEKVLGKDEMDPDDLPEYTESLTATFYTLKTSKGYLDWRWFGESNGYYSEDVECELIGFN